MYEQPVFYGSYARRGRIAEVSDRVFDYDFGLGELAVTINGENKGGEDLAHAQLYGSGGWSRSAFANRYDEYSHGDPREIVIAGADPDSGRNLLLVANSYSNCMERLFTRHYASVTIFDFRDDSAPPLRDYLSAHPEIDDVVILANPAGLMHARLDF